MARETFKGTTSLLTSKLNIEFSKRLVRCCVWSIALYGSVIWTLRKLECKHLEDFEMWYWRRMEKKKWSDRVTKNVLERIGERRTVLNNILRRKWI